MVKIKDFSIAFKNRGNGPFVPIPPDAYGRSRIKDEQNLARLLLNIQTLRIAQLEFAKVGTPFCRKATHFSKTPRQPKIIFNF